LLEKIKFFEAHENKQNAAAVINSTDNNENNKSERERVCAYVCMYNGVSKSFRTE